MNVRLFGKFRIFVTWCAQLPFFWIRNTMNMKKQSVLETVTIIAAIFMAAWVIRGEIAANTATIARTEGALLVYIGDHNHARVVGGSDSKLETQ